MAYNDFRPLNANEIHIMKKLWPGCVPHSACKVSYETLSGGFTVCLIVDEIGKCVRGVSRRSKYDKPNRVKGEALTFIRAIKFSRAVQL